jgi:hypothetical protein
VLELLTTIASLPSLVFYASWLQAHDAIVPEALASIGCEIAKAWDKHALEA